MLGSILQKVEAYSFTSQKTYLALGTIPFPWKFSFQAYKYDFELCTSSGHDEHKVSRSQIFH